MKISRIISWRYASYLLIVALVLISAGCSGSASTSAPEVALPETGSQETIITFAGFDYQRRFFESLMETFHEENPDITVQFVDISQSFPSEADQHTYYKTLAQAADTTLYQIAPNLDMSRYFREMRPLVESDTNFQQDDFWPGILSACEDSYGNMVGMPLTASINGIFYDEAAFDAAGVDYPKPGWTWDDFQNAVTALADKKGSQIKYGFYDFPILGNSIIGPVVANYLRSHGGEIDAAELLNEIQWYIDLAQAGMLSGIKTFEESSNDWDERTKLFEDEDLRPAMWIDALISHVPTSGIVYDPDNPFSGMAIDQFGFAPYPVAADGSFSQSSQSWVECAGISAGSTNPRAAWEWLSYLSRQWFVMDKTQVYEISRAPVRQSVADSSGYWDLLPAKAVPTVRYILEHGFYDFSYVHLLGEINQALGKTISDNADFVQVLEAAIAALPIPSLATPDNSPIVVATPLAPPPEGVTLVEYFSNTYNPNELNALKALIEQFNQRSRDTQVRLVSDFQGEQGLDWIASIAENTDCFTTNPPYWESFDASVVLNLNSLLSSEPASFSNDFMPAMMNKFRQGENLYGLPASSQAYMMAYNADLLARRGLSIPENDWTFDDFIELASAAASTSDSDLSYGYSFYAYNEFLTQGREVKWFDYLADPPQVYFDSPEVAEYLKWLAKLAEDNVILDADADWEKTNSLMASGQLGFWTAMMGEEAIISMEVIQVGEEPADKYRVGMAPLPEVAGINPMSAWSNDRGHYISAQSEAPQACWEWIKFMSDQPTLFTGVPARVSLAESPVWETSVGKENAEAYKAAIANVKPIVIELSNVEYQQLIWPLHEWRIRILKAALAGENIQQVLIDQQQIAETYLDCALVLDSSAPVEQLDQDIRSCLIQADPQGGWGP
jgi:ABC-type glycerol-3-phosphate transport system substrate-binding protein